MRRTWHRIARHKPAIIMFIITVVLYTGLALLFFGLMAVHNRPLLRASRTLGTTLLTYITMSLVMHQVYGGFDVAKRKTRPVISSLTLSILCTDLVTYLQLQIMNVNGNNNDRLMLFGEDFPPLLLCMLFQFLFIILLVHTGNTAYFRMIPPASCLLVAGSERDRETALAKISRYARQWSVEKTLLYDDPELEDAIPRYETVFLCGLPPEAHMSLLQTCYAHHRNVICRAQLEDIMLGNARQIVVDDAPFLQMDFYRITLGQRIIKRLMDIFVSGLSLIVLSPLLAIIALCIRLDDRGPVIFRQKRETINGRVFSICKFRTMSVAASEADRQVSAEQHDRRITRVGRFLRRYRLDELPQLWNIFTGDMTLVGPRPEMLDNVEKYKAQLPSFAYREKMKAGLTGYAQIEGRYNTTPEDKLMLDLMYIESFSLWLDIKLLFRTLTVFFKPDSTEGFSDDTTNGGEKK